MALRILHTVESYYPSKGGMQEVVKRLSELLVGMGHDISVATSYNGNRKATSINGVSIKQFNISGNMIRGITQKKEQERYVKFLKDSQFDIIVNFAAQQWATDCMLPILEQLKAKKIFVPTGFSGMYDLAYQSYFKQMKKWMTQYDMNVFLSYDYRDVNFARENKIKNWRVIPNGASEKEFEEEKESKLYRKDRFMVLHVGSHTGVKGHKETIEIFKRAKIKNATLLILGNRVTNSPCYLSCIIKIIFFNFSPSQIRMNKKVRVIQPERDETINLYHNADIFLFPSNIECSPIVLFEAAASKTVYLASDAGNSREINEWLKGGFILPTNISQEGFGLVKIDTDESAALLEYLWSHDKEREKIAVRGYKNFKKNYTWEKIAEKYESLYLDITSI